MIIVIVEVVYSILSSKYVSLQINLVIKNITSMKKWW